MTSSSAFDVSANGSTVTGVYVDATGSHAFIWSAATGIRDVKQLLLSLGLTSVANWNLINAQSISADGTTMAGFGIDPAGNQEGWVATIPGCGTAVPVFMGMWMVGMRKRR
jgi:uncharacterized membrane protein